MQPTVIPFDLTPAWYCITIFILIGVMLVIHWLMKKWTSLRKEIALWKKLFRLEGAGPDLGREHQDDLTTDV
jgi:hypothetical protein